jgi:peptidoglycan/LPS O-acetylase OafA/YrhL
MAGTKVTRLPYLDSARGLSALSVILWHFLVMFIALDDPKLIYNPAHIFYYGEANVLFFFLHSGFILSHSYYNKLLPLTGSTFIQFLIERIFRIIPLFLFVLFVSYLCRKYYVVSHPFYVTEHARNLWNSSVSFGETVRQSFLFYRFDDQEYKRILVQDWTLTIELIAGAFVPLLLAVITKRVWIFFLFTLVFYKFINTYIFEFSVGIAIYYFRQQLTALWLQLHILVKLGVLMAAITLYTCMFQFGSIFSPENIVFSNRLDRLFVTSGCALFFILILNVKKLQSILSARWIVFIGRMCYSLYLWHIIFLLLFASQLFYWFKVIGLEFTWSILFVFLAYILSTILISVFSFYAVEQPWNEIGKIISKGVKDKLWKQTKIYYLLNRGKMSRRKRGGPA